MTVPWTRSSSFSLKGLWLWWFSREVSAHPRRKMREGAQNTSQKLWRLFQKVQHAILKWWLMLALILEFQPLFHGSKESHISKWGTRNQRLVPGAVTSTLLQPSLLQNWILTPRVKIITQNRGNTWARVTEGSKRSYFQHTWECVVGMGPLKE